MEFQSQRAFLLYMVHKTILNIHWPFVRPQAATALQLLTQRLSTVLLMEPPRHVLLPGPLPFWVWPPLHPVPGQTPAVASALMQPCPSITRKACCVLQPLMVMSFSLTSPKSLEPLILLSTAPFYCLHNTHDSLKLPDYFVCLVAVSLPH